MKERHANSIRERKFADARPVHDLVAYVTPHVANALEEFIELFVIHLSPPH
jgi:hypothetical protein